MNKEKQTLVFVYNAKSGFFNKLSDFTHKVISPQTYSCDLCSLTHGTFSAKKEWTSFLEGLNYNIEFLYKNEIEEYKDIPKPIVFLKYKEKNSLLLNNKDLSNVKDIAELIEKITQAL